MMIMMINPFRSLLAFVVLVLLLQFISVASSSSSSSGLCLENQKTLLVQLKHELKILVLELPPSYVPSSDITSKLDSWSSSSEEDCCLWGGVTCDNHTGFVIGLDLSSSFILGGINDANSSSLFGLTHLQHLNLAMNVFESPFPEGGLNRLLSLTHLNLSNSHFEGEVPRDISLLRDLVSLDLSGNYHMKITDLKMLLQNRTNMEELLLDEIDLSNSGNSEWSQIISSALPNLRLLSLRRCGLVGPIHHSFSQQLPFLTHLSLSFNDKLSGTVPNSLTNLTSLMVLGLAECNLIGKFPDAIFLLPSLTTVDLSRNTLLTGFLPKFPSSGNNSFFETIDLSHTGFSGIFPDTISNHLSFLKHLNLLGCSFSGSSLSSTFEHSTELLYLDLEGNNFSGPLPWLTRSKKLETLILSNNGFTGTIPLSYGNVLRNLSYLYLWNNSLQGVIPSSLFTIPFLMDISLGRNQLTGEVKEFPDIPNSALLQIDLGFNQLQGPIPMSIFKSPYLKWISLSHNNFITFSPLADKVKGFGYLEHLDLSNNKLTGDIPNWMWNFGGSESPGTLNLSHNMLSGIQKPGPDLNSSSIGVLDLHSNLLQGPLLNPPPSVFYLDYSNNNFTAKIPSNFFDQASSASFISLSNNNMVGEIPISICKAKRLGILNLSNNQFNGSIPQCLSSVDELNVINLRNNRFEGTVPQRFGDKCGLRTLNLNHNHLEGPLPSSLANCKELKVLDLGNNHLDGSFPMWLGALQNLSVLVLRSNNFGGSLQHSRNDNAFTSLQIFDISSNKFKGHLTANWFQSWKAMMNVTNLKLHLSVQSYGSYNQVYYQDSVMINMKGREFELVKILTTYVTIDLSNNQFEGKIPQLIGKLEALYALDMSGNNFIGSIPSSFGELKELESLDLSHNQLSGKIPPQLTLLTFLGFINLSRNQLTGEIPRGPQFNTFSAESFKGNLGLCGPPLSKACYNTFPPPAQTHIENDKASEPNEEFIDWEFFWSGFGVGNGVGILIGLIVGNFIANYVFRERSTRKKIARKSVGQVRR